MYRKEKSSWKSPFGLTVFVWIATLMALFIVFTFLRIEENYIGWGVADLSRTYNGNTYYNYAPIIIAFLASFLPLLAFPIGKRMRGHQRLLAFALFLVTAMIFFTSQCFSIDTLNGYFIGDKHYYDGIQLSYGAFITIKLYSYNWKTGEIIFNFWGYIEVLIEYLLCFLPLLAFPMANAVHKKNQGSKTVTIMILLVILTCWAVNLYLVNYSGHSLYYPKHSLYWANIEAFDFENISFDSGIFFFLGITLASVLPLLGLGIGKTPKKVENHYEVTKIIYCPIERNDRD